jgi:hypothetical protein
VGARRFDKLVFVRDFLRRLSLPSLSLPELLLLLLLPLPELLLLLLLLLLLWRRRRWLRG